MKLAIGAYLCALSMLGLLPFCGGIDRPSVESEEVTYQSGDGLRIVASWFAPSGGAPRPTVILLHETNRSRAQWDEPKLPGILVKEGYAVLAPDLGGFGESTVVIRDGREESYQYTNEVNAIAEVKAAIDWLKGRNDVDLSRIAVIGAGLGGDLAYGSTAAFPEVRTAVVISPSFYDPDNLIPLFAAIPDFKAHDIYYAAGSRREWEAAATLGVRTDGIGGDRYEDHSDLDGVALLTIDQPIKDILKWFETRLLPPPAPESPAAPTPPPTPAPS